MPDAFSQLERRVLQGRKINPVTEDVINRLEELHDGDNLLKSNEYIRGDPYLNKLLKSEEESLVRYHFQRLLSKNIGLCANHLSLTFNVTMHSKLNRPVQYFHRLVEQFSKRSMLNQGINPNARIEKVVLFAQQNDTHSLSLLKMPQLTSLLKELPTRHQVFLIQTMLSLSNVKDPFVRQTNRCIIKQKVGWLPGLLDCLLQTSWFVVKSAGLGYQFPDPYELQCSLLSEIYDTSGQSQELMTHQGRIEPARIPSLLKLYARLNIPVSRLDIQMIWKTTHDNADKKLIYMISDALCQFARSIGFYKFVREQPNFLINLKLDPNSYHNVDQVHLPQDVICLTFIVQQIIQKLQDRINDYWLYPIRSLLKMQNSYQFSMYCITNNLVQIIGMSLDLQNNNSYLIKTKLVILQLLSLDTRAAPYVIQFLFYITPPEFLNELVTGHLYPAEGFVVSLLGYYRYYLHNRIRVDNQLKGQLEIGELIREFFEHNLLQNPSKLFIASTLMPDSYLATTLMIMIMIVSNAELVFQDWLKYTFQEQLLKTQTKTLQVGKIDGKVARSLKQWIKHYDCHPRQDLEKHIKMSYFEIRKMVMALIEIFE